MPKDISIQQYYANVRAAIESARLQRYKDFPVPGQVFSYAFEESQLADIRRQNAVVSPSVSITSKPSPITNNSPISNIAASVLTISPIWLIFGGIALILLLKR